MAFPRRPLFGAIALVAACVSTTVELNRLRPLGRPEAHLRVAIDRALLGKSRIDLVNARNELRNKPLSAWPLVAAGVHALNGGRISKAESALTEAYHRDPRNRVTVSLLAMLAARTGDDARVLTWFDRLADLKPEGSLAEAAQPFLVSGSGQATLGSLLAKRRPWAKAALAILNQKYPDIDALMLLNAEMPDLQGQLIERIGREQGIRAAYIAWLDLSEEALNRKIAWPINGDFSASSTPTPFSWRLENEFAFLEPAGGLSVTYFGDKRLDLASQAILLGPGTYVIAANMSGESEPRGGKFLWSVECPETGVVARLEIAGLKEEHQSFEALFEVPVHGCDSQRVKLVGLPGEFPKRARSITHSLQITVAP